MKKVKDWLQLIPDKEVREKAIANAWHEYQEDLAPFIATALKRAFMWSRSPEGNQYWKEQALKQQLRYHDTINTYGEENYIQWVADGRPNPAPPFKKDNDRERLIANDYIEYMQDIIQMEDKKTYDK